jgi:hypothetical protein
VGEHLAHIGELQLGGRFSPPPVADTGRVTAKAKRAAIRMISIAWTISIFYRFNSHLEVNSITLKWINAIKPRSSGGDGAYRTTYRQKYENKD